MYTRARSTTNKRNGFDADEEASNKTEEPGKGVEGVGGGRESAEGGREDEGDVVTLQKNVATLPFADLTACTATPRIAKPFSWRVRADNEN